MILECLKCHKNFETENRYKSYCAECDRNKKKTIMKTVIVESPENDVVVFNCQYCGKEFTPTKMQIYRHVNACPGCIKKKVWYPRTQ